MFRIVVFSIVLVTTAVVVTPCACEGTVEVKLKDGFVSGKVQKTLLSGKVYNAFKGIPYAEPPVGELRFKPPKPHSGFDHVYEAYKDMPTCIQVISMMRVRERLGVSGSEDCLYVSVFTPSLEGSRAVVVFDFHDNYKTGYNGTKAYSPEFLLEEDVVVVTVSHRLGLLGYLTTEDDVIPPNNGLRDYILALKWIQNNIKHFGGDANRVTLMGCKGGGSLVNNLLYSKAAEGLFHGVTMQSGTSHEPSYFNGKPRDAAFKLAKILEIQVDDSESLLKELQSVDYEKLVSHEADVTDPEYVKTYHLSNYAFQPVIEKENPEAIITTLPEDGKIVNDVPVLIGFNSREGLDINFQMLMEPRLLDTHEFLIHWPIRYNLIFDRNSSAFEDYNKEIKTYYFKEGHLHYGNLVEYSVYVGDVLSNYAINAAARKISAEINSPTYYYMFDFLGNLNENMIYLTRYSRGSLGYWGAATRDEICYLHLCTRIRDNYEELKNLVTVQKELKVLRRMVRLWANFAKTGNPTPHDEDDVLKTFKWKPIDKSSETLAFAHITRFLKMDLNPLGDREKFWDRTLKKYSEMAIDGVVQASEQSPRDEL